MLRAADARQAIRYIEDAIRWATEAGDPVMAGVAQCYLGDAFNYDNQLAHAIAELRAGVAMLEALSPEAWERTATPRVNVISVADARSLLAWTLAKVGAYVEALHLLGVTLDDAAAALDKMSYFGRFSIFFLATALGRPDVAKRAHETIRHVADVRALATTLSAFLYNTVLPYHADDHAFREGIADKAEQSWTRAQEMGLVEAFPVRAVRFPLDFVAGAWDAALTLAPAARRLGVPFWSRGAITLGTIALLQGEPGTAWRYMREELPEGAATAPGTLRFLEGLSLVHLGGRIALDADDLDMAREWAEASKRWLDWSGAVRGQSEGQALWAQYHRQSGDTEQAHEHAERALAHATEPRQPLALLAAHRLLGELDTDAGRHEYAARYLAESLDIADACQAPYERALTLLAMAALRAAQGASDEAHRLLDEVKSICAPLGAKPTLARADGLAARLTSG